MHMVVLLYTHYGLELYEGHLENFLTMPLSKHRTLIDIDIYKTTLLLTRRNITSQDSFILTFQLFNLFDDQKFHVENISILVYNLLHIINFQMEYLHLLESINI